MSMFDSLKSKLGIDTEADSYIDDTEDEIFPGGQGARPSRITNSRRSNSTAIRS